MHSPWSLPRRLPLPRVPDMAAPNEIRGEVDCAIAGQSLRLCCTMDGLARLSAALGWPTMPLLLERCRGQEPVAILAAVESLAVDPQIGASVRNALQPRDLPAAAAAVVRALVLAFEAPPGKSSPAADSP